MSTKIISARFNKSSSYRISSYIADGGYTALVKALKLAPDEIIELVKRARLNGRGGAGFPTGVKWSFVPRSSGRPVFLCVNADEGEPGTFKDRAIMERDPHALVEGAAIAARAIGAEAGFIYVRGEYGKAIERLRKAIDEARSKGFLGRNIKGSGFSFDLHVHAGAGAYVCGEETALIESLEGKRGMPRLRPPFPAQSGFLGCPTVVNNVETLANLPHIISRGPEWFASLGTEKHGGTKLFAVSGHVMKPGLYEFPLGTRFVEILNSAGGTRRGRKLKAFFPGGVSTPLLGADRIHVNMDFDSLAQIGTMLGSAGVIVMDDTTCMVDALLNLERFYAHESCG
ncbi:MAG: NADH-quinone oxidoreductase subunit NuoF, partial [Deltaproteobacteria bacterium]